MAKKAAAEAETKAKVEAAKKAAEHPVVIITQVAPPPPGKELRVTFADEQRLLAGTQAVPHAQAEEAARLIAELLVPYYAT